MATATRRLLPALLKTLAPAGARGLSTEKAVGTAAVVGRHTAKWMQVCVYMYPSPHRAPTISRFRSALASRTQTISVWFLPDSAGKTAPLGVRMWCVARAG